MPTLGSNPELSNTHVVSYQNVATQRVLLEKKKQIGSSVKDRNKLKKVCSRFYACISSLLIKPKLLHSEIGAIDANQRFLVIESNFC